MLSRKMSNPKTKARWTVTTGLVLAGTPAPLAPEVTHLPAPLLPRPWRSQTHVLLVRVDKGRRMALGWGPNVLRSGMGAHCSSSQTPSQVGMRGVSERLHLTDKVIPPGSQQQVWRGLTCAISKARAPEMEQRAGPHALGWIGRVKVTGIGSQSVPAIY